ncbi:MAG: carboxypeptidase regulatory-like domain-containing protein [Polyangiales bacterium]
MSEQEPGQPPEPTEERADERPGTSGGLLGLLALAVALVPAAAPLLPLPRAEDDTLEVRVVDEAGDPRVGVRVLVDGVEARTDPDGRTQWAHGGVLVIGGSGFARLEMRLSDDVEVVLPRARDLVGTVQAVDGPPLAAARVEILVLDAEGMPDESLAPRLESTDVNGRFELADLPPRPLRIRASMLGYAPLVVDLDADAPEVAIELEPAEALVGVVYGVDGEPAEGATVRLVGSGVWPPREVVADGDGAFAFGDVPPGIYEVSARRGSDVATPRRGLPFGVGVAPSAAEGGARAAVELHLLPGRSLRGRVIDDEGQGVADATLSITEEVVGLVPRELETARDGSFVIEGLAADAAWITARAPGYVGASVRAVFPGPVDIVLPRGAIVRGRVVDARGAPLANATVRFLSTATAGPAPPSTLRAGGGLGVTAGPVPPIPLDAVLGAGETASPLVANAVVVTDAEGRFVLEGVPAGVGELQADQAERGDRASARSGALRLVAGEVREDVELVLPDGGRLEGRVVDGRGYPRAGVPVELSTEREPWSRRVMSEADGSFRFGGVLGVGVLTARPFDLPAVRARFAVAEGETRVVSLVVETTLATVELRVFDGRGFPVEGATLTLRSERADRPFERTALSTTDGTYAFVDVPEGVRFRLEAQAPSGRWSGYVEAGARELRVVLAPGGRVEGRVLDEEGRGRGDVAVRLEGVGGRVAVSDDHGAFRFDDVAPGDYELSADAAEALPARTSLTVVEGVLSEAELVLIPGGTIAGEIVDVLGDPVPNAEVRVDGNEAVVRSDDAGRFRVAAAVGLTRVSIRHASAGTATSARVRVARGETSELRLVTNGRLAREDESSATSARFVTGVAVRVAFVDGSVRVVERLDASARALRVGDRIVEVDTEPVFSVAQADGLLRGPADVPAMLVVRRGARERSVRVPRTRHLRE